MQGEMKKKIVRRTREEGGTELQGKNERVKEREEKK